MSKKWEWTTPEERSKLRVIDRKERLHELRTNPEYTKFQRSIVRLQRGKVSELCRRYPYMGRERVENLILCATITTFDEMDLGGRTYSELCAFWNWKVRSQLFMVISRYKHKNMIYISNAKIDRMTVKTKK